MKTLDAVKKDLLKDPQLKREYDKLELQFKVASQIITMRQEKGVSQAELAKRMGTKQSAIARIESGNYNPSLKFLEKIAVALDVPLSLKIG